MDFKKDTDKERTSLAMDRDNVYAAINNFISAAIPMNNKLKDKTDEQLTALYPDQAAGAIAVRDWLSTNAAATKTKLEELKALLES